MFQLPGVVSTETVFPASCRPGTEFPEYSPPATGWREWSSPGTECRGSSPPTTGQTGGTTPSERRLSPHPPLGGVMTHRLSLSLCCCFWALEPFCLEVASLSLQQAQQKNNLIAKKDENLSTFENPPSPTQLMWNEISYFGGNSQKWPKSNI